MACYLSLKNTPLFGLSFDIFHNTSLPQLGSVMTCSKCKTTSNVPNMVTAKNNTNELAILVIIFCSNLAKFPKLHIFHSPIARHGTFLGFFSQSEENFVSLFSTVHSTLPSSMSYERLTSELGSTLLLLASRVNNYPNMVQNCCPVTFAAIFNFKI